MADYIYLLENRLSAPQRSALGIVREIAKAKSLTLFLVGGAVRDLTSGSPVRDLDVVVQGNALKLKKDIAAAGGVIAGEHDPGQTLFVRFPGAVRMEIGSTLSVTYPKPGKPVVKPATILDDLRRRDFTANAMALSLNEGSYGLLMDPLNGVADIENRELRLVSNYGFIEDPVRMIRAARFMARLGWAMDEKTQSRYDTGKDEGYISALSDYLRGYETEQIIHEEDPLRVLSRLETEGWMQHLASFWTSAKVNVAELERLRDTQTQLQMQGIHPDPAAANFPLLTAKLTPKEVATLKESFPRKGFVAEIESLEAESKDFTAQLTAKTAAAPSASWKLIMAAPAEAVLWTAYSSKSAPVQAKFKSFYTDWPQARHKIPYTIMQEMRIVKELPIYDELLEKLFFELMDGKLQTPEEIKAFLEPYSPPAPPPPVNMRRLKAAKAPKGRAKKVKVAEEEDEEDLDLPAIALAADSDDDSDSDSDVEIDIDADSDADSDDDPDEPNDPPTRSAPAKTATKAPTKAADSPSSEFKPATTAPPAPAKKQTPPPPAPKTAPVKTAAVKTAPDKTIPAKKIAVKTAVKVAPKKAIPAKSAPAKKIVAKKSAPVSKKTVVNKAVAPAKKIPAKKIVPAKKAVPLKKPVPAKKSVPAKKAPAKAVKAPAKKTPVKAGKKR